MALRDDVLRYYPQYAWALDIPDVAAVLQKALPKEAGGEGWDASRFQAELERTSWWQGTVPAARTYLEKQKTDPASLDQSIRQLDAKLWDLSQSLGLNLSSQVVDSIARQAIQMGWNEQQWTDALIMQGKDQGVVGNVGTIGTTQAQLRLLAKSYYVDIDPATQYQWARQVAAGEKKLEDFQPLIQDWAKSKFAYSPEITRAIDGGTTVRDYFAPMQQEVAKLLEVTPESIDFSSNPQFTKIFDFVDDKSQRRMMTIPEAQRYVRGLDQWKSTRQGQQAAADMAETLLKTFGEVA